MNNKLIEDFCRVADDAVADAGLVQSPEDADFAQNMWEAMQTDPEFHRLCSKEFRAATLARIKKQVAKLS